jgi:hypothetical protein
MRRLADTNRGGRTVVASCFQLARQNRHHGIVAQIVMVVEILIAKRDPKHSLAHQRYATRRTEFRAAHAHRINSESSPCFPQPKIVPTRRTERRVGNCQHRSKTGALSLALRDDPRRHSFAFSDANTPSHAHGDESCNHSDKNLFHLSLPNWKDGKSKI